MAQTITRLYATADQASAAVAALRAARFPDSMITVIAPPAAAGPAGGHADMEAGSTEAAAPPAADALDAIVASIAKAGVLTAWAKVLAPDVQKGGTVVSVRAPFGSGQAAIRALDAHAPIASGSAEQLEVAKGWDDSAPASSMLQWDTKLSDPTPFATFWNIPTLTARRFFFGEPALRHNRHILGTPALINKAAMLPWPTQTKRPFALGEVKLLNDATPLSSKLSLPVLSASSPRSR